MAQVGRFLYLKRLWILSIPVFILFAFLANGQSPTAKSREAIIADIKAFAERHVKNNSPMQTQMVVDLYRSNTVGLAPQEIAKVYEAEYGRLKEVQKPGPFEKLLPYGWLAAALILLAAVFNKLLKDLLSKLFKKITARIYNRLAGSRFFRRTALKHYKKALNGKYKKLTIPFRPERPLEIGEIFVPLKVAGAASDEQVDAYQAMEDHHSLMVLGPPGSGKSMLFKHIAFSYSEGQLDYLPDQPVPVLVELHRLNNPDISLEKELAAEFERNGFPSAEGFVSQCLKQGRLMLLLDGLDEISSNERKRVVQQVKDLIDRYEGCRVLITCRTAVYRGEFTDIVNRTMEIIEFQDQQIRGFLKSWEPGMPADKSVEQLMQTLQDRPRIMALARNPLLLTIIAYLYTDTPFVLPHSRAEFYQQSTDVLLRQWHQEHNKYPAPAKRSILQHLALYGLDNVERGGKDRRALDYQTVLTQVRQVLPDLNLRQDQDAGAILEEIVERSGLLLSIDGGERFQFAHLTLQEFFAAARLTGNPDGMIKRFRNDHDGWREAIKLWCGLAEDSTGIIRTVYEEDSITAFECLADAQQVDNTQAKKITDSFKERLGEGAGEEIIVRAFSAVASDLRPRGASVFQFLIKTLKTHKESAHRIAAANALSLTNLPQAAKVLAGFYADDSEFHSPLVRMGDLAMPHLAALAEEGSLDAMDDLQFIGTPHAAEALVPLLWNTDLKVAERAAWLLASLLPQSNIEEVLRDYNLTEKQRKAEWLDWIWQPFNEPQDSSMPVIAGRIAYLIHHLLNVSIPKRKLNLDPRLVIPLCSTDKDLYKFTRIEKLTPTLEEVYEITLNESPKEWNNWDSYERSRKIKDIIKNLASRSSEFSRSRGLFTEEIIKMTGSNRLRYLFSNLPPGMQFDFIYRITKGPSPNRNDWLNIFKPLQYEFKTGLIYRSILIIAAVITTIALGQVSLTAVSMTSLFTWKNGLLLLTSIALVSGLIALIRKDKTLDFDIHNEPLEFAMVILGGPLILIIGVLSEIYKSVIKKEKSHFLEILVFLPNILWSTAAGYFMSTFLLNFFPSWVVWAFWITLFVTCTLLWRIGRRHERKAQNPLHGILDAKPVESRVRKMKRKWKLP